MAGPQGRVLSHTLKALRGAAGACSGMRAIQHLASKLLEACLLCLWEGEIECIPEKHREKLAYLHK